MSLAIVKHVKGKCKKFLGNLFSTARAPPLPYRGTPPNAGPPRPPSYPPGVRPPMRSPSLPFRGPPPNAGPPRPPSYPPGVRPPIRTPFPSPRAPQPNSFPQRTSIPSSVQPPIPPDQKNEQLQLANTEPVSQSNSPPIRLTEAEQQLFEDLMAASKCRNDPRRNEFIRLLQAFRDNNPDLNQYKTILALVKIPSIIKCYIVGQLYRHKGPRGGSGTFWDVFLRKGSIVWGFF